MVNGSAMLVGREVTLPTNAPIYAPALLRQLSTPAPTRGANSVPIAAKQNYVHRKVNLVAVKEAQELQMWSLVYFSSMTLLQLCYLILEHHIISYLQCMLRSIICP
jgi:hypothetical protein